MPVQLIVFVLSVFAASCLNGHDPFENSSTAVVEASDRRSSTPSGWRSAFGVSKWSFDDWASEAELEVRIFHAMQGEHPTLFRAARTSDDFWIEKIVLTGLSNGQWGTVLFERALQIVDFQELEILLNNVVSDEDFCNPLAESERAALDSFTGDSLWMIEVISGVKRTTILMHNIDGMTADMIDAFDCRDFRKIVDAKELFEKIFENAGNQ